MDFFMSYFFRRERLRATDDFIVTVKLPPARKKPASIASATAVSIAVVIIEASTFFGANLGTSPANFAEETNRMLIFKFTDDEPPVTFSHRHPTSADI
jgi:hypothetical protein